MNTSGSGNVTSKWVVIQYDCPPIRFPLATMATRRRALERRSWAKRAVGTAK